MKRLYLVLSIIIIAAVVIMNLEKFAVLFTEKKKAEIPTSEISKEANSYFWESFHRGNYDSIPIVLAKLNAALAANPNDLLTTAHLAFTHAWALSERQRLDMPSPVITEHALLARRYFDEAYKMNDKDPRIHGFLADFTLTEAAMLNNKKEQVKGYFMGLKSVKEWPQFNKFTVGYNFSGLPVTDKNFHKAIEWQYESFNDCACEAKNLDKLTDVEKTNIVKNSKDWKIKRACWNTWIAPHNFEGFCMSLGDMLVKNNQVAEAKKTYELARMSDTYNDWIYKDEMEARIKNAEQNVSVFNAKTDERNLKNQTVLMFSSKMACGGCHRLTNDEMLKAGKNEPTAEYYFLKDKY